MRIILAPDKFKGSADAEEVAAALEAGLRSASAEPDALDIVRIPVADGGEGTVQAALSAGYSSRSLSVTGPVGLPVEAAYAPHDGPPV
ncbi:MAG: glycerate kinase, partial [Brachybacterium sp.]|nr:glycerate kinase [Brachybacterium sp.]